MGGMKKMSKMGNLGKRWFGHPYRGLKPLAHYGAFFEIC